MIQVLQVSRLFASNEISASNANDASNASNINNASNASDTSNASKTSTSIEGLVFTKRGQCDEKSLRMTTGWHTSPARSLSRKNDVCPMEKAAGHRFPSRVSRQEKVLALHTEAASSAPCSALLFFGNGNNEMVVSGGKVTDFRVGGPKKL